MARTIKPVRVRALRTGNVEVDRWGDDVRRALVELKDEVNKDITIIENSVVNNVITSTTGGGTSTSSVLTAGTGISVTTTTGITVVAVDSTVINEINDVKAITTKTADYTLGTTDCTIIVDASGGDVTIDTPAAPVTGKVYTIKRIDGSGNVVTVDAASTGSTTIDDSATQTLNQYDALRIQFDGTEWWIV